MSFLASHEYFTPVHQIFTILVESRLVFQRRSAHNCPDP